MYKPGSVIENETDKILWDFDIQKIRTRDNKQKGRTCHWVDFAVRADFLKKSKR